MSSLRLDCFSGLELGRSYRCSTNDAVATPDQDRSPSALHPMAFIRLGVARNMTVLWEPRHAQIGHQLSFSGCLGGF